MSEEWDQVNDHFRRPATENVGQPQPGDPGPEQAPAAADFHAAGPPPPYDVQQPELPRHAAPTPPQQFTPPADGPPPYPGQPGLSSQTPWPPFVPPPEPNVADRMRSQAAGPDGWASSQVPPGPGWQSGGAPQNLEPLTPYEPSTNIWPVQQGLEHRAQPTQPGIADRLRGYPPPQGPPPTAGAAPAGYQQHGYPSAQQVPGMDPRAAYGQNPFGGAEASQRRMDTNKLVDALSHKARAEEPLPVPSRGWRRAIHRSSFGTVNPGLSQAEKDLAERRDTIGQNLRGECFKIAVLVGKGGTGTSTVATAVASIFSEFRPNDRVIAMDADPSFGKLAERIDPDVSGTYWELLAEQHNGTLNRWTDVADHLGSNSNTGLWLLRGEHRTHQRRLIDAQIYTATMDIINRYMQIAVVDCGKFLEHSVMPAVLHDADAAIIVGALASGAGKATGQTLHWMEGQGYHRLMENTVVVLNDPIGRASKKSRNEMFRDFDTHTDVPVVLMPYDEHLGRGGIIDTKKALSEEARLASIEIANAIADRGFGGRGLTGPVREQGTR